MSAAWIKIIVARLMIEECDYLIANVEHSALFFDGGTTAAMIRTRKAYWEKVLEQASLDYSLEGGS